MPKLSPELHEESWGRPLNPDDRFTVEGENAVSYFLAAAFKSAREQLQALGFNEAETERELGTLVNEALDDSAPPGQKYLYE
jgi:hypothetical protein